MDRSVRRPLFSNLDNAAGAGWCWIDKNYQMERLFFHYSNPLPLQANIVFVFIDAFALTVLYCILFFHIRMQLREIHRATTSSNDRPSDILDNLSYDIEAQSPPSSPSSPAQVTAPTSPRQGSTVDSTISPRQMISPAISPPQAPSSHARHYWLPEALHHHHREPN